MKRLFLIVYALMAIVSIAVGQDDPEYKAEIGAGAGLVAYQGDFGGNLTSNMQPLWGIVGKYRFNPRMSLSLNIVSGTLKGSSKNTNTWYPELNDTTIDFSTSIVDAGVRFEYNFWPFGTGREYRGARVITPYIVIGLGATYAKPQTGGLVTFNIPLGIGVKYKLATRLNLSLEGLVHFTQSDKLDGVEDPYGIKRSGLFKNTDCYTTFQLSLTYDIMAKCKTCHNDRY